MRNSNPNKKKIVILAAGGTGGHVFPGLAVAKKLIESNFEVVWLGTKKGLESKVAKENNFTIYYINAIGLRGKNIFNWIKSPFLLVSSIIKSMVLIYKFKPCCILGMGGFVSAAGGISAILTRTPLVIQEQNAIEGTTNKLLSFFSKKIFTGFPMAFESNTKAIFVGNPLRDCFYKSSSPKERFISNKPKNILILGGSLGASKINEVVTQAVKKLSMDENIDVNICHQTGIKDRGWVENEYASIKIDYHVEDFFKDINKFYQNADLVICRSGALTVSEIIATGVASILIPFPHAINNHQEENANWLVNSGAAFKFTDLDITSNELYLMIKMLVSDDELRIKMAENSQTLLTKNSSEKIISTIEELSYAN